MLDGKAMWFSGIKKFAYPRIKHKLFCETEIIFVHTRLLVAVTKISDKKQLRKGRVWIAFISHQGRKGLVMGSMSQLIMCQPLKESREAEIDRKCAQAKSFKDYLQEFTSYSILPGRLLS